MIKKLNFFLLILFTVLNISCSPSKNKPLAGYIEGEYTYIASGIAGTLLKINVTRGQMVKKDMLLFKLDPEPDQAFMESAKSNVELLKPQVALAKLNLARQHDLYLSHNTSKAALDQATSDYEVKVKQLASAEHTLTQAEWAFAQKTVYSPIQGMVFDVFFREGEKVSANQPVLALLSPENIKVLFYIPEKELSQIRIGQKIKFRCDGCAPANYATINYISPEAEYTPPIIYNQDTRYKLVYLVRATLEGAKGFQFHPGQPLDVHLHD